MKTSLPNNSRSIHPALFQIAARIELPEEPCALAVLADRQEADAVFRSDVQKFEAAVTNKNCRQSKVQFQKPNRVPADGER